jgi:post-segregation antitoxin (ccd killing protein)
LPTTFDPTKVQSVSVIASSKATVLSGNISTATTDTYSEKTVALTAGPTVTTNPTGTARVATETYNGVSQSYLRLRARNLPVSTTYELAINGNDVQAVQTSAWGGLHVNTTLAAGLDITTVTSVTVHDSATPTPNVILSASF